MLGNSKLLTMAAIGVIGVGAAMPYWSRSELSSPQSGSSGYADSPRVDAFIGQDQNDSQPEIMLPQIRKIVSLEPTSGGLDTAAVTAPNLTGEYPAPISSSSTQRQLVDLSPQGYQRVSIARRDAPAGSVESFAIPVEMPAGDVYEAPEPRHVQVPAEIPAAPSVPVQEPKSRWQSQTTSIVVNKPVVPQTEVQQTQSPSSYVAPPQPRSLAPAQPRRHHRLVDGDTLPKLAERYLGRADLDWAIFEANRDVLSDPQLLPLKVEIDIPAVGELDSIRQGTQTATPTAMQPLQPLGGNSHLRLVPLVPNTR
ncbi:hypothetical protein M4951_09790 [Blastopirellula sp. J2-11]|uniref:LysM peptidoglycan-binding domain-containing protein n=1 Tax=Blastopirellula sp. J2-11 TaxID=2943192 RepID=UPI0021CA90E9|nr:hypothetical protein [Blastopirellula sp. J2-11]UUO08593.1 hypothetical protein M4951_09790 [Blastopirellula sp. J2-11]